MNEDTTLLEDELKKKKKLPKYITDKLDKKVFTNLLFAIGAVIYFCFINLGYRKINADVFLVDLTVFGVILGATAVFVFERAYRKDNGYLSIFAIELTVVGLFTLLLKHIYYLDVNFIALSLAASLAFAIYYVFKSIVLYLIEERKYKKSIVDIKEIVKKEE